MGEPSYRVVRVFNNNAVLVRQDEDELVVVGRGIGFGRRTGDRIAADNVQRQYVEIGRDKAQYLELMNSIDPRVFEIISTTVDLAVDLLGELHPSVYLLLADHLAFAVQRFRDGAAIVNPLLGEIRVVFPTEFGAAELMLGYINSHLGIELPTDEAAFITLHLNAARTGSTVKQPLQQANVLGGIVEFATTWLGSPAISPAVHDELVGALARLANRLESGAYRVNLAARSIQRDLPHETELARQIVLRILQVEQLPREAVGEVANLAVFLHGWQQDVNDKKNI